MTSLFRDDAVAAQQNRALSEVTTQVPGYAKISGLVASGLALCVVLLFVFGAYTKRVTVVGALVADRGAIRLIPQQTGRVISRNVEEGAAVRRGQALFVVSADRSSDGGSDVLAALSEKARDRQNAAKDELAASAQLSASKLPLLQSQLRFASERQGRLEAMLGAARERLAIVRRAANRLATLGQSGFATQVSIDQANLTVLEAEANVNNLDLEQARIGAEIADLRTQVAAVPAERLGRSAQLQRSLSQAQQDLLETNARRTEIIRAPFDGVVTGVDAQLGQVVSSSKPVAVMLPRDRKLQAELYAPPRAIGFIKPGTLVRLRYEAFPYQKFGQYQGRVRSVSMVPFAANDVPGAAAPASVVAGDKVYVVTVELGQQAVRAYGMPRPLQPGMSLQADLLLERRKLYEWVLEPLYTLNS